MSNEHLILSDKYKAFLQCNAPVEFLEGTTAAGKTTVGVLKFMLKVAESKKKLHILSGLDLGTIEKNIINKDVGIIDNFGELVEYNAAGKGKNSLPHILYHTSLGDKIIYVLGYDNRARWKKALGGQYGCLYIDEINIADMEYVREAAMRCDYLIATLNPDDQGLQIYKEYINCSRPLTEWESETPVEILDELKEESKAGWVHWFFSFAHNLGFSAEKVEQIKLNTPRGTNLWKNKIEGLRGRATGLIFSNFEAKRNIITKDKAKTYKYTLFTAGIDTAYSNKSNDIIAFIYQGITEDGKLVTLDEQIYNNRDLNIPIAPSDTVIKLYDFLEKNRRNWGLAKDVFIDSADQATITELKKFKRQHPCFYNFFNAYKKVMILDRINFQIGWIGTDEQHYYEVVNTCVNHIKELNSYSWKEDRDEPEDANDHTINANQYAWLPYKDRIGVKK